MERKLYPTKVNNYVCIVRETAEKPKLMPTTIIRQSDTITFHGCLPMYPKFEGEVTIVFHRQRNLEITIAHNNIHSTLTYLMTNLLDKKMLKLQLDAITLTLQPKEAAELYEVVKDYYQYFIRAIETYNQVFCIRRFAKASQYPAAVRIMKIKRQLWKMMLYFAHLLDYRHGSSKLHVFDSQKGMLKIPYHWDRAFVQEGYYAVVIPEQTENSHEEMTEPDQFIWLTWRPLYLDQAWNAVVSYRWLCYEYIPHVIYYFQKRAQPTLSYEQFLANFDIDQFIFG